MEILVLTMILFNLILYLKCLRSLILLIHSGSNFNDYLIHSKPQTGVIMWVTEEFSSGIIEKKSTSITLSVCWLQEAEEEGEEGDESGEEDEDDEENA